MAPTQARGEGYSHTDGKWKPRHDCRADSSVQMGTGRQRAPEKQGNSHTIRCRRPGSPCRSQSLAQSQTEEARPLAWKLLRLSGWWDFPGGPAAKNPSFHRRVCSFSPWLRSWIPHASWYGRPTEKNFKMVKAQEVGLACDLVKNYNHSRSYVQSKRNLL